MLRRSSRTVPIYSELFSIASRAASLPKSYCVRIVLLHLRKTRSLTQTKFMVVELYISALDKTWQWLNEYFPDWSLPWILRVDASDIAVCNALLMVETRSPYSLVQEVRCNNRYSMEYHLPYRVYGVSSTHRWRVQHIRLGNLHVHAWR